MSCDEQTIFILYVVPLTGDALQFIVIDKLQAFGFSPYKTDPTLDIDAEDGMISAHVQVMGSRLLSSPSPSSPVTDSG